MYLTTLRVKKQQQQQLSMRTAQLSLIRYWGLLESFPLGIIKLCDIDKHICFLYSRSEIHFMFIRGNSILYPVDAPLERNIAKNYNKNVIMKFTVLYN